MTNNASLNARQCGSAADTAPNLIPEPRPFPTDVLPTTMCSMVNAVSKLHRTPDELAACCALATVSAAIGKGLEISSLPQTTTPANLYLLTAVRSGGGKSQVFKHLVEPLIEYEKVLIDKWNPEERENPQALICENITSEGMIRMLSENNECLASLSADARDVIDVVRGRYRSNNQTDDALYLKAFSGDFHRVNRARKPAIILKKPIVTCLWMVQPDKWVELYTVKGLSDGGLLPRFMACPVVVEPAELNRNRSTISTAMRQAWSELVTGLIKTFRMANETKIITPTDAAKTKLYDYHDSLIPKLKHEYRDIQPFVSRWTEHAWRVALVLHTAQWGIDAPQRKLSVETAESAIRIVEWFAGHQVGFLKQHQHKQEQQPVERVLELCRMLPEGIKAKDVYRRRITRNAAEAEVILKKLETAGILVSRDVKPEGGGKVARIYTMAPAA